MLMPEERRFIELSIAADRRRRFRTGRRVAAAVSALIVFTYIVSVGVRQFAYGIDFARTVPVVWNGERSPPVSAAALSNLRTSVDTLGAHLRALSVGIGDRLELSPWAIAQMWPALRDIVPGMRETGPTLRDFMHAHRDKDCQCWKETEDKLPHTLATAWVLYALAHYDQPATAQEIELVLERQGETGWWAMFPATADEPNASMAATAWSALALHHQLERNLIAPQQIRKV